MSIAARSLGFISRHAGGAGRRAYGAATDLAGRPASAAALRYAGAGGAGAATGAIIGGVTAIPDRDRGFISGAIGGAFWGAAAGIGGRAGMKKVFSNTAAKMGGTNVGPMTRMRGAYSTGVMGGATTAKGGGARGMSARAWSGGIGGAAVVTGAYGTGNWLIGNSRKRKRYSRYGRSQGLY